MNWDDVYKIAMKVCDDGETNKNGAYVKKNKNFIVIQMGRKSILLRKDGTNDSNCTPEQAMSIVSTFA